MSCKKLKVLPEFAETTEFQQLAVAFKRVKNIAKELPEGEFGDLELSGQPLLLTEPAELTLLSEIERRGNVVDRAVESGEGYRDAFAEASRVKPAVDAFFNDVLVMAPDPLVRKSGCGCCAGSKA